MLTCIETVSVTYANFGCNSFPTTSIPLQYVQLAYMSYQYNVLLAYMFQSASIYNMSNQPICRIGIYLTTSIMCLISPCIQLVHMHLLACQHLSIYFCPTTSIMYSISTYVLLAYMHLLKICSNQPSLYPISTYVHLISIPYTISYQPM